ncbi:hypothetical protein C2W62_15655 [Candidatus Entotheonella serta]|nr:hypothetical protein C2W62_15655 [Candidatus Entotheonella serta]
MAQPSMPEMLQENLTLYALGLLDAETAAATESYIRARGLPAMQALQAMEHVVAALGYGAPAAQPRPQLRQHLFDRIAPQPESPCSSEPTS